MMLINRFKLALILVFLFMLQAAQAGPVMDRIRERVRDRAQQRTATKTQEPSASKDPVMSINVNGVERKYVLHVPISYQRATDKIPLVLFFHGGKSHAEGMDRLTGFNAAADANNFIVVYPKGIDERWNDGRGSREATADDVGFVSALIDRLILDYRIDSRRVYATGISNGAILLHLLAGKLADKIAAIAPVAGSMPTNVSRDCHPSRNVPVLMIHGTKDPLILWGGGTGEKRGQIGGSTLSVPETIKFWASIDGCGEAPPETTALNSANDGTTTFREQYCSNVVLYKVINGGHTWPGGWQYAPEMIIGKTSKDFNATQVIWKFFKTHSR